MKIHPSDLLLEEVLASQEDGKNVLLRHLATCSYCCSRLGSLPVSSKPADRTEPSAFQSMLDDVQRTRRELRQRGTRAFRAANSHDYAAVMERTERTYLARAQAVQDERSQAAALLDDLLGYEPQKRQLLLANSPRFSTWGVFELALERSWQFRVSNPVRSEDLAHLAIEVSERLDAAYYSPELIEDLRARGWSYIGNLRRMASDLEGSELAFEISYGHLRLGTREPLERAMFLDLKASLRRAQRRFDEGMRLLKRAVAIFLRQGDQHGAGKSLVSLSLALDYAGQSEQAIGVLRDALTLIDPSQDELLVMRAWHNLIVYHTSLGRFIEAQGLYRKARALYARYEACGFLNRRLWVKGKIERGLGQTDSAEALLLAARKGFLEEGIAYEAALVSMELATLYAEQKRTAELKQLAIEMLPIFTSRHIHREALAALIFLKQAAEAERLSFEMAARVADFLRRAQSDPGLKFEAPS